MEWNEWMFRALSYPSALAVVHDTVKPASVTPTIGGASGVFITVTSRPPLQESFMLSCASSMRSVAW